MNALFKLNQNNSLNRINASLIFDSLQSILFRPSVISAFSTQTLFNKNKFSLFDRHTNHQQHHQLEHIRSLYSFNLSNRLVKYRRATRPKKTNDNSVLLNYEQAQFAEKIGLTKSWNIWNTSNLLDGKRQAETIRDDILIKRFLTGTFHDLFVSEFIIKRRFNTINIGFLLKIPKNNKTEAQKVYFLIGYSEELLSHLLKCPVKIQVQSIYNKNDLVFKRW